MVELVSVQQGLVRVVAAAAQVEQVRVELHPPSKQEMVVQALQ
jgi:hypothetical protein